MKTLKDFEYHAETGDLLEDLRDEAQQWINKFENGDLWTDFSADQCSGTENIVEWIQHFFDIEPKYCGCGAILKEHEQELSICDKCK